MIAWILSLKNNILIKIAVSEYGTKNAKNAEQFASEDEQHKEHKRESLPVTTAVRPLQNALKNEALTQTQNAFQGRVRSKGKPSVL